MDILVLAADPWLREALSFALESAGHCVVATGGHDAALDALKARPPDIVVSEVGALTEGAAFGATVRVHDPRIALVVLVTPERSTEARTIPGATVLVKPFRAQDLLAAIASAAHGADAMLHAGGRSPL